MTAIRTHGKTETVELKAIPLNDSQKSLPYLQASVTDGDTGATHKMNIPWRKWTKVPKPLADSLQSKQKRLMRPTFVPDGDTVSARMDSGAGGFKEYMREECDPPWEVDVR